MAREFRRDLVNWATGSILVHPRVRNVVLRRWGVNVGRGVLIKERVFFGGRNIELGDSCSLNIGCVLDNTARIVIGARARVGMEVMLITSTHEIGPPGERRGSLRSGPIEIGAGAWIGSRVTVMPGVTIGAGCVVGAGSLVTADCEPNTVYAGSPARPRRTLES